MELLHRRCCGLDVHKETVVAYLRLVSDGKVTTEVRTFQTTTADLLRLSEWLAANETRLGFAIFAILRADDRWNLTRVLARHRDSRTRADCNRPQHRPPDRSARGDP
jgi:hypothetical protein